MPTAKYLCKQTTTQRTLEPVSPRDASAQLFSRSSTDPSSIGPFPSAERMRSQAVSIPKNLSFADLERGHVGH
jgi:virulence-associated protein VagC